MNTKHNTISLKNRFTIFERIHDYSKMLKELEDLDDTELYNEAKKKQPTLLGKKS